MRSTSLHPPLSDSGIQLSRSTRLLTTGSEPASTYRGESGGGSDRTEGNQTAAEEFLYGGGAGN